MFPECSHCQDHSLVERFRLYAHGMAETVVVGEGDSASPGGHEKEDSMFAWCSPCSPGHLTGRSFTLDSLCWSRIETIAAAA